jgi:hypothetical protein
MATSIGTWPASTHGSTSLPPMERSAQGSWLAEILLVVCHAAAGLADILWLVDERFDLLDV